MAVEAKFRRNVSQLKRQVEARLGKVGRVNSLPIETGVSVVYPDGLTSGELEQVRLWFAAHQVRKDLDAALWRILGLADILLPKLNLLRNQWCAEPSVHGSKGTRPDFA